ncbi:MAG: RagB/SusD family nutrient uptake outer membrane protein [Bacteroidales bacterium]|nr:RagB/SusD family nutrient uptake outer membrane protein [Bacteroidales bacterium]
MKSIKTYIYLAILSLTGIACQPEMDLSNPNELTTESYYRSGEEVTYAVNGAYNMLQRNGGWGRYMFFIINGHGDDWDFTYKAANGEKETPPICNFTYDAANRMVYECWDDMYAMVYASNLAMEKIPLSDASGELKDRLMGEAYFLRGLAYYYLGQLYGEEIPVMNTTPKTRDDFFTPSAAPGVLYKQMTDDFIMAAELLPVRSVIYANAADIGRATKGSALGYLARAYMNRTIFQQGTLSDWAGAEAALKQIIESGEYELAYTFRDNHTESNENNKESLFEVQFFNGPGSYNDAVGEDFIESWGSSDQSTWREQEIGQKDGGDNTNWWNMMPTLRTQNEFEPDDPRHFQSLWCPDGARYRLQNDRWVKFTSFFPKGSKDPNWGLQFGCRKYCADESTADWESGINDRLLRYSDVLLMYAECLIELNRESEAIPYINQVRARANNQMLVYGKADTGLFYTIRPGTIPAVEDLIAKDTVINGLQINTLRRALKHERWVELFGEGVRFTDLLRWSYNPNDPDQATVLDCIKNKYGPGIGFIAGRHEYFPIPSEELSTNPNVKPNRAN